MMDPGPKRKAALLLFNIIFGFILPFTGFVNEKVGFTDQLEQPSLTSTISAFEVPSESPLPEDSATPTPVETAALEITPGAPEFSPTSSFQPTDTLENLQVSATPSLTYTATSPAATPTRTAELSCDQADAYRSQITVSSLNQEPPKITGRSWVVNQFIGTNGNIIHVVQVEPDQFCRILYELQKDPSIEYAEPNYSVSLLDVTPNDPGFSQQYYFTNIRAPMAWEYTTGSPAVILAILDSGIDLTHADLIGRYSAGYDFVENDSVPQDENGHGTIVTGIAAAHTNNGVGVAGVNWNAQIMPIRVLDAKGNGSFANVAQAIIWATDQGARVINMSFGGSQYSSVLEDAVDYAVNRGVILVAATGNTGANTVLYPAAFPGVVGVGATDQNNRLAWFSNTGAEVDVVAPGVSIYGLGLANGYTIKSGTSMSAPQVAGFAALLAGLPGMQYSSDVIEKIESSAKDLGTSGWDSQYGYGLIQMGPAIKDLVEGTVTPKPPQLTNTSTETASIIYPGRTATPSLTSTGTISVTPTQEGNIQVTPTETSTSQTRDQRDSNQNSEVLSTQAVDSREASNQTKQVAPLFCSVFLILCGIGLFLLIWLNRRPTKMG